jgi:hypothetical protein
MRGAPGISAVSISHPENSLSSIPGTHVSSLNFLLDYQNRLIRGTGLA